jgi:hypothetical protein
MYSRTSQSTIGGNHAARLTQALLGPARRNANPSAAPSSVATQALLTRQEAAAYIGVQPNTLATWACTQRYDLPYVKVGRNVRYRKQDLEPCRSDWLRPSG